MCSWWFDSTAIQDVQTDSQKCAEMQWNTKVVLSGVFIFYIYIFFLFFFFAMKPDFQEWLYEKKKIKIQNR